MEIKKERVGNIQKIVIKGSIKTLDETTEVRKEIDDILSQDPNAQIEIYLKETELITSSLIGIFVKLIYGENAKISIFTDSEKLYKLIDRLNLINTLNVKKI